jgi:hypothetical protein
MRGVHHVFSPVAYLLHYDVFILGQVKKSWKYYYNYAACYCRQKVLNLYYDNETEFLKVEYKVWSKVLAKTETHRKAE